MRKVYKLIKDLPHVPAGAIFEQTKRGNYKYQDASTKMFLPKEAVENNPQWFDDMKVKSYALITYPQEVLKLKYMAWLQTHQSVFNTGEKSAPYWWVQNVLNSMLGGEDVNEWTKEAGFKPEW